MVGRSWGRRKGGSGEESAGGGGKGGILVSPQQGILGEELSQKEAWKAYWEKISYLEKKLAPEKRAEI